MCTCVPGSGWLCLVSLGQALAKEWNLGHRVTPWLALRNCQAVKSSSCTILLPINSSRGFTSPRPWQRLHPLRAGKPPLGAEQLCWSCRHLSLTTERLWCPCWSFALLWRGVLSSPLPIWSWAVSVLESQERLTPRPLDPSGPWPAGPSLRGLPSFS